MLRNDQTLQKIKRKRKGATLTFIFLDQNNENILSFDASNLRGKFEEGKKMDDSCTFKNFKTPSSLTEPAKTTKRS